MKALIFIALICLTAAIEKGELYDLQKMYEQGTLAKFLALTSQEGEVSFDSCKDDPIFYVTNKKVKPPVVTKGQSINLKAMGVMKKAEKVDRMELQTFLGDENLFNDTKKKGDNVGEGQSYLIEYEANVPAFVPSGHWRIYIRLYNDQNEELSCMLATFDSS